eukprot:scaffold16137_cov51-Cyclotella_meneghiniana.AAC.4
MAKEEHNSSVVMMMDRCVVTGCCCCCLIGKLRKTTSNLEISKIHSLAAADHRSIRLVLSRDFLAGIFRRYFCPSPVKYCEISRS